jgi:uncharacterized membrane protein YqiK
MSNDLGQFLPVVIAVALIAISLFCGLILVALFYRKLEQGKALVITTVKGGPIVSFTGRVVYPIISQAEIIDVSVKLIEIQLRGAKGVACKDGIRADIAATFYIRVNKTQEDVLKVAEAVGCARASDPKVLTELFRAKFCEAIEAVASRMTFEELRRERLHFKEEVICVIGQDLNGFVLDDAAIDQIERTPSESIPDNE